MTKKYLIVGLFTAICLGITSLPSTADNGSNYNEMVTQKIINHGTGDLIKNISEFNRLGNVKIIETKPHLKKSNQRIILSDNELISILQEAGFKGESLKMAWAIAIKESTGRPYAFNKSSNCYGLFQINMSGSMGPDRRKRFKLKSNNDLFDPLINAKVAYLMSYKGTSWSAWSTEKSAKRMLNN